MKRTLLSLVALSACLMASCGGGGGGGPAPSPPVSITISPTTATLEAGDSAQFTATVTNTTNTSVTWQVNDITGGNATVGTISSAGLYIAPSTVPSPDTVTVKAIAQADTTKSASATVTIRLRIGVTVTPETVTLPAGGTQQFTATVQNTDNTAVTWQVNSIAGGNATVGTITAAGLYTAPLAPPPGGSATVTAVSQANPNRSDSATATIQFSNATLAGPYAFNFTGVDSWGLLLVGGSFVADGNGNLTSGVQDLNHGSGVYPEVPFTGTYTIEPDGRGTIIMDFGGGDVDELRIVMLSHTSGRLMLAEPSTVGADSLFFPDSVGVIEQQDPTAFLDSALSGGFAMGLAGLTENGFMSTSGRFNFDGAGNITNGVLDVNDSGLVETNSPFTGTYSVASTGRATATLTTSLGTFQYSFYVVSASRLLFVSLDWLPAIIGPAEKQQSASFSNASLSGNYAALIFAQSPTDLNYSVGRFTADGAGSITNGRSDDNETGFTSENNQFTATYAVSSNGRGTLTLTSADGTANFAFAMVSSQKAFLMHTDPEWVSSGVVYAQQGTSFNDASVAGSYAVRLGGFGPTFGFLDISGQASANGAGALIGVEDVNDDGTFQSDIVFTGTYSVASNGRVTLTTTDPAGDSSLRAYLVSGSKLLVISMESDELLLGVVEKQF